MCFFIKRKTAYEIRISDWSSDVCSSDLRGVRAADAADGSAQFVENRGELNLKGAPRLGQFQPVVVAVEQRPPDRMLQRLDTPRQRGHRQAKLARGGLYR